MENTAELLKPPFSTPVSFTRLFDSSMQSALLLAIRQVRENAERIGA